MILFWSSVAASVLAVVGCGYLIAATILVRRFARDRVSVSPTAAPGVTVLKPLHGDEPGLFDNLSSVCIQNYPGHVQIVFGVQDADDGAVAVVERLRKVQADRDLDLVIETKAHGLNRKVSNLVNMAPRIRHDVVVLADSDMRVGPDYLSRVIAALEQPGIGAVSCLYYGVGVTGIWARLCALVINAQFLPSVVVGLALGLARPCFGSTLALRCDTLAEIGGFEAFADCLADDYAIGEALRAHGCKISIPPFAVAHVCTQRSLRGLWRHQLRWARTIRSIDPAGYAGSIVSHAFPWALIAALVGASSTALLPAIAVALASIACRMALLRQAEQAFALPPQAYWLVPACDLLSFAVFVFSFLSWDVSWKGRRFRMVAGGAWMADRGAHYP
jgi:ceramide glucosyltransferase